MPSMLASLTATRHLLLVLVSSTVQEPVVLVLAGRRELVATSYCSVPGRPVLSKGKLTMLAPTLASPLWLCSPSLVGTTPPWSSHRHTSLSESEVGSYYSHPLLIRAQECRQVLCLVVTGDLC